MAELATVNDVGLRGCRNQRREVQNIEHVEKVSPDPKFGSLTQKSGVRQPEVFAVTELDRLLPEADIVVLIVPLTAETHGMIGAAEISLMKPDALLVNAARGPVIVTDALVDALQKGRIRAVLDVTENGHHVGTKIGTLPYAIDNA